MTWITGSVILLIVLFIALLLDKRRPLGLSDDDSHVSAEWLAEHTRREGKGNH
jgi:hypothetical protein